MRHVRPGACEEIVDAQHLAALRQEAFAQMRPDEPRAAGDQDALVDVHAQLPNRSPFQSGRQSSTAKIAISKDLV
jgi:hypothetical protein